MTVEIDVELQGWRGDLADLKGELKSLNEDINVDLEVTGHEELAAARADAELLDGKELDIGLDVDRDALKDLDDLDLDLGEVDLSGLGEIDDLEIEVGDINIPDEEELNKTGIINWVNKGYAGPPGRTTREGRVVYDAVWADSANEFFNSLDRDGTVSFEMDDESRDLLEDFRDDSGDYRTFTTRHSKSYNTSFSRGDAKERMIEFLQELEDEGLLDDMRVGIEPYLDKDALAEELATFYLELEAMEPELEVEVCLKKCDDWDDRFLGILEDLAVISGWEERDSEIDVNLKGTSAQIDRAVETVTDGGATEESNRKVTGIDLRTKDDFDRLMRATDRDLGLEFNGPMTITADDIPVTEDEIGDAIFHGTGDHRKAKFPQRNLYKSEYEGDARQSALEDLADAFRKESRFDYSHHPGEFGFPDDDDGGLMGFLDGPVDLGGGKGRGSKLSGLFDALIPTEVLSTLMSGSFEMPSMKGIAGKMKKAVPKMRHFYNIVAALIPALTVMAVNALGVAAAMGTVAVAGGAVIGLGLLGWGDNLVESMEEAKARINEFKSELYGVFKPTFQSFSPITESFLNTASLRIQMSGLPETLRGLRVFEDSFNAAFDGILDWVTRFIGTVTTLEPLIEQMAMTFGSLIGDFLIDAFIWLTEEAYRNQDVLIGVSKAVFDVLGAIYSLFKLVGYLITVFQPLISALAWVVSLLGNRWVIAIAAAIGAMAALFPVLSGVMKLLSILSGITLASAISSIVAFGSAAVSAFLAAAEALAVLIAGEATLLSMTGAGLLLVATGISAGVAAYNAIKPKGQNSYSPSGTFGGGYGGGGGVPGGSPAGAGAAASGSTVINFNGPVNKETLPHIEDRIESVADSRIEHNEQRNPDT